MHSNWQQYPLENGDVVWFVCDGYGWGDRRWRSYLISVNGSARHGTDGISLGRIERHYPPKKWKVMRDDLKPIASFNTLRAAMLYLYAQHKAQRETSE